MADIDEVWTGSFLVRHDQEGDCANDRTDACMDARMNVPTDIFDDDDDDARMDAPMDTHTDARTAERKTVPIQ